MRSEKPLVRTQERGTISEERGTHQQVLRDSSVMLESSEKQGTVSEERGTHQQVLRDLLVVLASSEERGTVGGVGERLGCRNTPTNTLNMFTSSKCEGLCNEAVFEGGV